MFRTYKVPTTVLKIGVEIRERFSHCLLSSQKLFTKLLVRLVLLFFLSRTEIFELIGSGFPVVDNFHSQFWCSVIISAFLFLFRVVKQPYLKPKASFVKTKVICHFVSNNVQMKQKRKKANVTGSSGSVS